MYDYNDYRNTIEAVRNTTDSRALRSALRGFLCESAMTWWRGLEENQRKAIVLLDFNPAVVTTMVFFGDCDWGFGGSYGDVLDLILDKAELLAKAEVQGKWDYDLSSIIHYARMQAQAEQAARDKAMAVAQELGMVTGLSALEDLLVENSGDVRNNRKHKKNLAKEMRKAFLSDALRYLEHHHNDQPTEEEDE